MMHIPNMRPTVMLAVVSTTCLLFAGTTAPKSPEPIVTQLRVPDDGLQPQVAVDDGGTVHLVYFRGEAAHGDLLYVRSTDGGAPFSRPMPVNHQPGSAIATGTVRGAQIAVGRNGRVHVAWNGSGVAMPKVPSGVGPLLYTRLDDAGRNFERERNIIQAAYGIDGGSAVAADRLGRVYVAWHAPGPREEGEANRRVWVVRSSDEGRTFENEEPASEPSTGACGCCGLSAFADRRATLYLLYRSAFETVHRDMFLLASRDGGRRFSSALVDRWNVGACVMSTEAFAEGPAGVLTAWETQGQVYFGRIDRASGQVSAITGAPGTDRTRKHPALAADGAGNLLFAWTEGTAWSKGGSAAWQVFDASGRPSGVAGRADHGVPVWGLVAAYARPAGGFAVVY
jgi:hypothetical protein